MKTKLKAVVSIACVAVFAVSFSACSSGKCTLLGKPAKVTSADYIEITDGDYVSFKDNVDAFASAFAAAAYENYDGDDNFAVAPVSVYMALSLAAECAGGDTRNEVLNALGVSYGQLREHFSTLYRSLNVENEFDGKVTNTLKLGNSVWVNEGTQVNTSCIDALSDYYYAYSYSADFGNDNKDANLAIRNFVKKQTKGLIDQDFELSDETLFALINTLYLKTIWNTHGDFLTFTEDSYVFKGTDGEKPTNLLQGDYNSGRVYESENFSTFFTSTVGGYKIKFIVPKDGYSVDEVFTAENISEANSITDYNGFDYENKVEYLTRCLFPEYKAGFNGDIREVLQNKFDVDLLFKSSEYYTPSCDFSSLTERKVHCDKITHVTKLTVDKKGVEGAAVTVIDMPGDGAPEPVEKVYADFVIDRAFGFVISDYQNVALFSGVVNNI